MQVKTLIGVVQGVRASEKYYQVRVKQVKGKPLPIRTS